MRYLIKNQLLFNEEQSIIAELLDHELNAEEHALLVASKDMYMLISKYILDLENNRFKTKATYKEFKKLLTEINKKCTELKM